MQREGWGGAWLPLTLFDPSWSLSLCLVKCWSVGSSAGWLLRVTKEVWQGRWAFSCAGWDSIPEEAAVYGCAVAESARGGRCVCCRQEEMLWDLCFIPSVFFPIASDSVWKSSSEIKWVFFLSCKNIQKLVWAWAADKHKPQQMRELKVACEIEFFCISQPGLFNICVLTA